MSRQAPLQQSRSQIVEASKKRRIERWRAMCDAMENPNAPHARPEATGLYSDIIGALGGPTALSPQQLMVVQRAVVTQRRLDQIHFMIEREGRMEFLTAETSYSFLLLSLLKSLGLEKLPGRTGWLETLRQLSAGAGAPPPRTSPPQPPEGVDSE